MVEVDEWRAEVLELLTWWQLPSQVLFLLLALTLAVLTVRALD
jgi:hypothetical protein